MNILNDFNVKISFPVSWGEMDAYQHINNVAYFRYFENSRMLYFEKIGLSMASQTTGVTGIVKSLSCEYIIPIVYPDIIEVGSRVTEINEDGFKMEHYIRSETRGLCAFGEADIAIFNIKSSKTENLPDEIKRAIELMEQKK